MLKYRKESKAESIDEPVDISLEKALAELDKFPTEDEGSWLNFIFDDKDIQLRARDIRRHYKHNIL